MHFFCIIRNRRFVILRDIYHLRRKYVKGKSPGLKKLTKDILKVQIQSGEHSLVEDARVTMLLYKSDKAEFEKLHKTKFVSKKV